MATLSPFVLKLYLKLTLPYPKLVLLLASTPESREKRSEEKKVDAAAAYRKQLVKIGIILYYLDQYLFLRGRVWVKARVRVLL